MVQPVDLLLTNAIVISMDNEFHLYEPGAVAVTGEKIVAVGNEADIKAAFTPKQTLDCGGKALLPGLINAHTHTPMTLLRGLADDLRLDVWLMGYMMPVEREFVSPEFVRDGTLLACAEMIRSGVTTFADMYYFESDIAQAAADAGMRALCGESILKFPSPDSPSYEDALAYTREFIKKWKGHPLITPVIAPHAYYTNTDKSLEDAAAMAVEFDVPLHTHISETAQEVENIRNDTGMPVVPFLKKHNLFTARVIGAHCVHIDEGEMRTMIHAGASAIHNPSSNLKLASGIAPVNRMLELGMNVGIGTDGTASNNDLDMFEEIRLASFIAKVSTGDPTALPARTALLMATRMGAQALHIGDKVGSLEPGKLADMILIDITPLHNSPRFHRDPNGVYAQIIYASKATDVTDVMIHGRWVMQNRQLTTIQEAELLHKSAEYARQIDQFLIKRENSVLSKLIAIGDASEEESFEVQTKVRIDDIQPVLEAIRKPEIEIVRERLYREYDVYFKFDAPDQGYIRYREDHFVEPNGEVSKVRLRLTHIGPTREHHYPQKVLLSRSRYLAPARQSLRFYREYFKPDRQIEIEKERRRFLVRFKDTEFFVNLDTLTLPALGKFLEVKSRTWSQSDAKIKSKLVSELIHFLGASTEHAISQDYIEMVK